MRVKFVAGFAPITTDPDASRALYVDALKLPLDPVSGDYIATEAMEGAKHLGVWPLSEVAQACFGTSDWPSSLPRPQATLELEVDDVAAAEAELVARGYELLHGTKTEPWGQTITRLLSPEGIIVGLCHTPSLAEPDA